MENLNKLFVQKGIWSLTYYEFEGICKFIRCVDLRSGIFFMARVSSTYDLAIPNEFSKMILERISRVRIVEDSAEYASFSVGEETIRDMYGAIHMDGDEKIHRAIYEQMKRIGRCFENVEARVAIVRDGVLCEMMSDYSLAWFKVRSNQHQWLPVVTIEFIEGHRNFSNYISSIESKFNIILIDVCTQRSKIGKIDIQSVLTKRAAGFNKKLTSLAAERVKLTDRLRILRAREESLNSELETLSAEPSKTSSSRLRTETEMSRVNVERQLKNIRMLGFELVERINENSEEHKSILLENEEFFHDIYSILERI